MDVQPIHDFILSLLPVIIIIGIWDAVWKIIAMWKSARRKQLAWFICIAIFNTEIGRAHV